MLLTDSDVAMFARVSGDSNPLHRPGDYARATPFGGTVAHGVLALLALIDEADPDIVGITRMDVEFRGPVQPGIEYRTNIIDGSADGCELVDGTRVCLSVRWYTGPATEPALTEVRPAGAPDDRGLDDLTHGLVVRGDYGPRDLAALQRRFPFATQAIGLGALVSLLWAGYVSGMRLPGERCLLGNISVRCRPLSEAPPAPLRYSAELVQIDRRFGLMTVMGKLESSGGDVADVEIESLVRSTVPLPSASAIAAHLQPSERMAGQSAVVVGGSRGLGAAIALALVGQGCDVWVGHRGVFPDQLRAEAAELPGELVPVRGDASDPSWSAGLAHEMGQLDVLVCSAAPPIRPLEMRPEHLDRLEEFVVASSRLLAAPLTGFLAPLERARGRCLVVSSSALSNPPKGWPHYVTAKAAHEGLVAWAARNHPLVGFAVARPGMLRTEQTNTPGAGERSEVEPVAATLVRQLLSAVFDVGNPLLLDDPSAWS